MNHIAFSLNRTTDMLTLFINGNEVANTIFSESIQPTRGFIGGFDQGSSSVDSRYSTFRSNA